MRRSIDDQPISHAGIVDDSDEFPDVSWAVGISDDYEDDNPRLVLTVEELGKAGAGLVVHLDPDAARRLRVALRDGLREIGETYEDSVVSGESSLR